MLFVICLWAVAQARPPREYRVGDPTEDDVARLKAEAVTCRKQAQAEAKKAKKAEKSRMSEAEKASWQCYREKLEAMAAVPWMPEDHQSVFHYKIGTTLEALGQPRDAIRSYEEVTAIGCEYAKEATEASKCNQRIQEVQERRQALRAKLPARLTISCPESERREFRLFARGADKVLKRGECPYKVGEIPAGAYVIKAERTAAVELELEPDKERDFPLPAPEAPVKPTEPMKDSSDWWWGWGGVAGGGALVAVGLVGHVFASDTLREVNALGPSSKRSSRVDDYEAQRWTAVIGYSAGALLMAGGVYFLARDGEASVSLAPHGDGISFQGRF